jgi:menaquinol-cytochrome c reductase iron-sulfur subunit
VRINHVVTTDGRRAEAGETRRTFYIAAIYGIWGIISAALTIPAIMYLLVPPKMRKQSAWIEAGDLSQVPTGTPVEMRFRRMRVDGWKVSGEQDTAWVLKAGKNQVVAFGPQCTHLGCAYHWDTAKNEFVCPCHNSLFSIDGRVLGGPAPRPFDRYETKIEGDKLMLGPLRTSSQKSA